MIPPPIIRFIEERASLGFAGTRDSHLVPCGHRVSGWQIEAAGRTLVAFIPASSATRILDDLQNNGPIAITLEEVGTHETYQVKGRYLRHRPVGPAETEVANRLRERFVKGVRTLFGDLSDLVRASIPSPSLALEIEVLEVFVQTPGPGAGARIAPPPDAERSAR